MSLNTEIDKQQIICLLVDLLFVYLLAAMQPNILFIANYLPARPSLRNPGITHIAMLRSDPASPPYWQDNIQKRYRSP